MKKHAATIIGLFISMLTFSSVTLAHGSLKPQHSGLVQEKGEFIIELVVDSSSLGIYLKDHDEPLDTSAVTGKVTVLGQGVKSEAVLKPAGANHMTADISVEEGAKILVQFTEEGHSTVSVRFSL